MLVCVFYDQSVACFQDVTSPHTLTGLEPFTHYEIYVLAVNKYGVSLPSPTHTVWTEAESKQHGIGTEIHSLT